MPPELTIIAVTALLAGLLLVGIMLAGRRGAGAGDESHALSSVAPRREPAEPEPSGAADATLRVLESKAAAGEAAGEVGDLAMRVCGGAAYRKDVGVERVFRDSRAALVMGPTTDVLYDFIGKAVCGLPLF